MQHRLDILTACRPHQNGLLDQPSRILPVKVQRACRRIDAGGKFQRSIDGVLGEVGFLVRLGEGWRGSLRAVRAAVTGAIHVRNGK
jgi:hypothetical protein